MRRVDLGRSRRFPGLLVLALAAQVGAAAQLAPPPDAAVLRELTFRTIGPAITGGRVADIAAVESRPATFYVAASIGGVWKTVNAGTTWQLVLDPATSGAVGDVAVAPSDPNVVWAGTGENNPDHGFPGDGVYKSMDAGQSWTNVGLTDSHHIGRIVIDPDDPNIVYVAAQGHLWGPNRERGLFKTTDGGRTWANILFVDEHTGCTDVMLDPSNRNVLIAATYQRRRSPWGFNGGGPASGLHRSVDGGKTWTKLTAGLPTGDTGRIGLDVFRRKPSIVYARIEHPEGGVFRSDDGGVTWRQASAFNPQALSFGQIRVDPSDDQRVYLLGVQLFTSDDGGVTFRNDAGNGVHSDHRAMWIDPGDPAHIITGSDGGVYVSYDRARTWKFLDNLPIAQVYHVGVDMRSPYYIYGGFQDYGSWGAPSRTRNLHGVLNDDWFMITGADGFVTLVDPTNPNVVYTETQNGQLQRYDPRTGHHMAIKPDILDTTEALRWNRGAPFLISPHDPATIYAGANRVFRSVDRGLSWTPISPDLSTQTDRDELSIMGVKGKDIKIARNAGVDSYGSLTALAESTKTRGLLYAGTDDGNVQVTRDGGRTWTNVIANIAGVPKQTWVSSITTSWRDAATAYVTFDGHENDDFHPYVFMTTDAGATWKSIGSTLPERQALIVREDPRNPGLLYLGTEMGLFVSFDRGAQWTRLKNNLPTVPIDDLVVHPRDNDLILATRGRGIWILEDVAPLQTLVEAAKVSAYLCEIRAAAQYDLSTNRVWMGHGTFAAPNPPLGTPISYHIVSPVDDGVTLTIKDASGATVRELKGPGTAGVHRLNWDLRHAPPSGIRPDVTGGFWGLASHGPYVLPGTYRVSLMVNGKEAGARPVKVEGDPLVQITDADRQLQFRSLVALTEMQSGITTAATALRTLAMQVLKLQESLRGNTAVPDAVRSAGAGIQKRMMALQQLIGPAPPEAEGAPAPPAAAVMATRAANASAQGSPPPARAEAAAPPAGPRPAGDQAAARLARPEFAEVRALQRVLRSRIQILKSEIAGSLSAPTSLQREKLKRLGTEFATVATQFNEMLGDAVPSFNKLLQENGLPVLPGVPMKPLAPVTVTVP